MMSVVAVSVRDGGVTKESWVDVLQVIRDGGCIPVAKLAKSIEEGMSWTLKTVGVSWSDFLGAAWDSKLDTMNGMQLVMIAKNKGGAV